MLLVGSMFRPLVEAPWLGGLPWAVLLFSGKGSVHPCLVPVSSCCKQLNGLWKWESQRPNSSAQATFEVRRTRWTGSGCQDLQSPDASDSSMNARVWIISATSQRLRKWATSLHTIQSVDNKCRGSAVDSCLNNWPAALELLRLGAGRGCCVHCNVYTYITVMVPACVLCFLSEIG